jgi:hypothetical protein
MKYTLSARNEKKHGKTLFFLMVFVLIILGISSLLLVPPDFRECKSGESNPKCACPLEEKYIGKRNIVFVDVTDPLAAGKIKDVERIIEEVSFNETGLLNWIKNGKKVEKTSVYMLSDKKPVEMEPIATYCSLPPSITWLFSKFSERQERQIKDGAKSTISEAIKTIVSKTSVSFSHIVEGLTIATSSASNWNSGSKLILISDLYENSPTCGYFESQSIPSFNNISTECKKWVDILGENISKRKSSSGKSTIAICQILSKKQQPGLIAFWRELFQSKLGYDVLLTCDPEEIENRSKSLS